MVGVGVFDAVESSAEQREYVGVLEEYFGEHVPVVVVLVLGQVRVASGEAGPVVVGVGGFRVAQDEVQRHFFGWAAGFGPVAGAESMNNCTATASPRMWSCSCCRTCATVRSLPGETENCVVSMSAMAACSSAFSSVMSTIASTVTLTPRRRLGALVIRPGYPREQRVVVEETRAHAGVFGKEVVMRRAAVYKRCGCRTRSEAGGGRCPRSGQRGHGSWYFSLELPCGRDGRRHRVRRRGFRSRVAAEQARAYLVGGDVVPGRSAVTVGQWLDIWLEMRQSLSFNTRRLYTQQANDYLKPCLGSVPLRSLTVARVQAMFVGLVRANATRQQPLSPATFVRIRGTLHAALNGAIRVGLIERNPAHLVELPSGRRPRAVGWTDARVAHWRATGERPPVAVWTAKQTAEFLEHARGHPLYVLYLAVALLGLRRGEVAGLRWCDLDLDAGVVQVSHQVQDRGGRTVVCPPKTEASVRTVALDHGLVAALRVLRSQRRQGDGGEPVGFLFANRAGGPLSPGYVTHTFTRLLVEAGFSPVRLHDLRHGAASLSLAAGNDLKVVQAMLGHSSIVLTAELTRACCLVWLIALPRQLRRWCWRPPATLRSRCENEEGDGSADAERDAAAGEGWLRSNIDRCGRIRPHSGPTHDQSPPARSP